MKLHHALTDGLGLRQLLSQLHSRQRTHQPYKPQPPLKSATGDRLVDSLLREIRQDLSGVPALVDGAISLLRKGAGNPVGSARSALKYLDSARRVLSPPAVAGLPTLRGRGGSWRFVAVELEVEDLRAAARAVGASMNDAYLAALLGGFRRYHEAMGLALDHTATMPVSVPVSVRRDGEGAGGNRFAPVRLIGPVGLADAAARVERIRTLIREARGEPALESAELAAALLARLPSTLLVSIAGSATAGNDLQASNVPGVEEDLFLAGALIERIYGFAPLPGCAAMMTLHTYRAGCFIGANLDAAAVTDHELFARCLVEGFAEILDLARGATREPRLLR